MFVMFDCMEDDGAVHQYTVMIGSGIKQLCRVAATRELPEPLLQCVCMKL